MRDFASGGRYGKAYDFMKYYLAPMEGLTTYNFRTNWNRYYGGMDKYFTPFISNRHMNSRERNDVMPEHNEGMYTVPQILTNKAEEFLSLAEQLAGYGYCEVNLNLGCPSGWCRLLRHAPGTGNFSGRSLRKMSAGNFY